MVLIRDFLRLDWCCKTITLEKKVYTLYHFTVEREREREREIVRMRVRNSEGEREGR